MFHFRKKSQKNVLATPSTKSCSWLWQSKGDWLLKKRETFNLCLTPTCCFRKNFHKANSHLFAEESRHHNPEDPWDPDKKELVHSSSLFLANFLQVLRQKKCWKSKETHEIKFCNLYITLQRLQLIYYSIHLTLH